MALIACVVDDIRKTAGFKAGATHQRTVHVRLAEQFGGVVGFHAAAVLDAHLGGHVFAVQVGQFAANEGVHGLCLFAGGGFAGADGPDRLVGDYRVE